MKNGSRMGVTLSAGEEPSSAFVKLLQTKDEPNSTFYSQTQTSNIFQMPNTVLMYKKNDEKDLKDKRKDVKDKRKDAPHLKPLLSVSFASVCTACMICLLCQIYSILLTFIATTHHSLLQICVVP